MRPWVFKAATTTNGEILGHHIDAIISPQAASEKAQTMVSENRCTYPKIDVFGTAVLTLIATTRDNAWASFLVHQVPRTSTTVWEYRQMVTQFSLRVWASKYICRPIIGNLLYLRHNASKVQMAWFSMENATRSIWIHLYTMCHNAIKKNALSFAYTTGTLQKIKIL